MGSDLALHEPRYQHELKRCSHNEEEEAKLRYFPVSSNYELPRSLFACYCQEDHGLHYLIRLHMAIN